MRRTFESRGRWTNLYRAIHSKGDTIDFMLPPKRDPIATKHFLGLWRVLARSDRE